MATLFIVRRLFRSRALLSRCRNVQPTIRYYSEAKPNERPNDENTSLQHIDEHFQNIPQEGRNKESFLAALDFFKKRSKNDRGHVEFLTSALKYMKEYNLHKDLDVYKALLDVFPKGPLLPVNVFQKKFVHYPHQQFCCIKILDEMEWNLVYPDIEVFEIVKSVFGDWSMATKKIRRMLYWNPRLRYTNKYLDRKLQDSRHMDLSFVQRARMALEMMSRDKGVMISYSKVSDDKSLILSAQSPLQRKLITTYDPKNTCYYVDGPFLVYVAEKSIKYVTFTTTPGPDSERLLDRFISHIEIEDVYKGNFYDSPWEEEQPKNGTIHEQIDQTILALGVLENVNENSAFAWISHLQKENPSLNKSTVILRLNEE